MQSSVANSSAANPVIGAAVTSAAPVPPADHDVENRMVVLAEIGADMGSTRAHGGLGGTEVKSGGVAAVLFVVLQEDDPEPSQPATTATTT